MSVTKRLGALAAMVLLGLAPAGAAYGAVTQPTPSGTPAAALSAQDKQFLQSIHQVNLAEDTTGKLAQQKGTNQEVKSLGARFVTDHAQLDERVRSVASAGKLTLPDKVTSEQQAVVNQLQNVSGADFDAQWVTAQLTAHSQAMQVVQAELTQGSDPGAKQVAQQAAPVLQAHHNALVALAQSLGVPIPGGVTVVPSPGVSSGTPAPSGTATTPGPTLS
jgi:predicted outer membrane protein